MKIFGVIAVFFGIVIGLPLLILGIRIVSLPGWFANRSLDVVQQEVDPQELLRKYSWFKNVRAQLDAKAADIKIYEGRTKSMAGQKLDRTDRERLMLWEQEVAALKLSYNGLAADYNAQMAKINWAFTNIGTLPRGATEVLPREYAPYRVD